MITMESMESMESIARNLRVVQASQNYVNRMWENLLLAFIGEESGVYFMDVNSWYFMFIHDDSWYSY